MTEGMQDRRDLGHGEMQDRRDALLEGYRTDGAGKEGGRRERMQEMRNAGKG